MFVRLFIVILSLIPQRNFVCVKNRIKLWSPTKCEAGRTFFARLNALPNFNGPLISQPYLYPWLAQVEIKVPGGVRSCSGALINDRYILTSQSCILPPIQAYQVTVHLGFYNGYGKDLSEIFQSRISKRRAIRLILHPWYDPRNPRTAGNNLGLIKLKQPVKYSKTIYPVELPSPGDKLKNYANEVGQNVEWSYFPNYGMKTNKLLKDNLVRILSTEQCGNFDGNYRQIMTPEVICSLKVGNGNRPCGNENGGLLSLVRHERMYNVTVLIGITGWDPQVRNSCQDISPPRVYVRIDRKLPWIKENTEDGQYCQY